MAVMLPYQHFSPDEWHIIMYDYHLLIMMCNITCFHQYNNWQEVQNMKYFFMHLCIFSVIDQFSFFTYLVMHNLHSRLLKEIFCAQKAC